MHQSQDDKKLVQKYKQTNKALRQQLLSLSDDIDKLLIKKSNTVGIKKLPQVSKKLTDTKVMETQVQNMKKRLQLLQNDRKKYQQKSLINQAQQIKALQQQLQIKNKQKQELKRHLKNDDRYYKIQMMKNKVQVNNDDILFQKIQRLNSQIVRCQKIEKQLKKQISQQDALQQHKNYLVTQKQQQHKELSKAVNKLPIKNQNSSIKPNALSSISQQEWKQLKRQFLQLKQSKQQQEMYLYQQNDNLRRQIRQIQIKIKQKKERIDYIKNSSIKKARNYSTLQNKSNIKNESKSFRYRDRNNSIQYQRNTIQL